MTIRLLAVLVTATALAVPAHAHISYGGRDFGSFTGLTSASTTISNQAITSNYGWADATDGDYGDSHRSRAFRFHLDNEAWVTITAAANPTATQTSLGGLLPGFSVYGGLAHVAPAAADHDFSTQSAAYLATLGGVQPKEGSWYALGDWKIGSDDSMSFADLSSFVFKGYAADGTATNFGTVPGIIGDGLANGTVTGSFLLAAGDYSIFVGGADYAAQAAENPSRLSPYGVAVTLAVSPVAEPEAVAMMLGGLVMLGWRQHGRTGMAAVRLGLGALSALLLLGAVASAQTTALYGEPIGIEQARKAASAAIAEAKRNQWQIAVAIVDPGGDLVYFERVDGTQTGSIGLAIEKALTAVAYKRSTKTLEERVVAGRLQYLRQTGAIPIEGGLPIVAGGKVIGGLGVSGVRSEQDGVVALAGINALAATQ